MRMAGLFDGLAPDDRSALLRILDELRSHMRDRGINAACGPDV